MTHQQEQITGLRGALRHICLANETELNGAIEQLAKVIERAVAAQATALAKHEHYLSNASSDAVKALADAHNGISREESTHVKPM